MRDTRTHRANVHFILLLFTLTLCCEPAGGPPQSDMVVSDTTTSGIPVVRYSRIPPGPTGTLSPGVRIGWEDSIEFAQIRGLERTESGEILVLDYMAAELRRFSPTGDELELVATEGDGPREFRRANGIFLDGDGALWINDHGTMRFKRWHPDGAVETYPFFVPGFQYLWEGGITEDGRIWSPWTHSEREGVRLPPQVFEGTVQSYLINFDPVSEAKDSVLLGDSPAHFINMQRGSAQVPFSPNRLHALSGKGVIWTAISDQYKLVQLNLVGDTTLIVEVTVDPIKVGAEERSTAIADLEEFMDRAGRIDVDWDEVIPAEKPVLEQLLSDEEGNVWVRRGPPETPVYEGFSISGEFLGQYSTDFSVHPYFKPIVRAGHLVAVHTDSLDVESVFVSRIGRN